MNHKRISILGTKIDALTMQETVALTEKYMTDKKPLHLIGVNADKINEMQHNKRLKNIVNKCGIINADGVSVVMAGKFLGKPLPERVAGIDLMEQLVSLSSRKGYRAYLLGAKQEVVEKTADVLRKRYPGIDIAGTHNGYFKKEDWGRIKEEINSAAPQIVFVGITSPLKEYLIEYLMKDINCVFMGVGGSFDVISGLVERAPQWVQRMNMEWLFRVMQEPKRLFKRYFIGNWKFMFSILKEKRIISANEKNRGAI